jgi:uncharacterized protein (TIGR02421 family)
MSADSEETPPSLPSIVADRLRRNKRVRRILCGGGRLHIDRLLPFLCVHRWPAGEAPSGSERLIATQASYLVATDDPVQEDLLIALVEAAASAALVKLGGFLVIELLERRRASGEGAIVRPEFTLWRSPNSASAASAEAMARALRGVLVDGEPAVVSLEVETAWPGRDWLRASRPAAERGFAWIGLGFAPVHRGPQGEAFPQILLDLESGVCDALLAGGFEFARRCTKSAPTHRHELGRRAVVRNAWNVDRHLAQVADSFEFLRLVTPCNVEDVWLEFQKSGFRQASGFRYHPLRIDPAASKRTLYDTPIEDVEDVTLARLYRERQEEIDRQITMLRDRGRRNFFYGSLQLYGGVDDELREQALVLLDRLPPDETTRPATDVVSAPDLVDLARREISIYQVKLPSFTAEAEMRDDIVAGVMVSKNRLLVWQGLRIPRRRVDALLQHEVGTHLLTYFNGRAQRLRLLYVGLAGYEAFQEGLAVVAEYLVGALDRCRLRTLAGRVLACRTLVEGASLEETFDDLTRRHGFAARPAFTMAARVHRGGGLTKDAIYLRGLREALYQLSTCEDPRVLFAGKIAAWHVPIIEELRRRGVLEPIPLLPRYLERPDVQKRLARLREGLTLADLTAQLEVEDAA